MNNDDNVKKLRTNLKGMATEKQIALLQRLGVDTNRNFTKQAASDIITVELDKLYSQRTKIIEAKFEKLARKTRRRVSPTKRSTKKRKNNLVEEKPDTDSNDFLDHNNALSGFSCTHDMPHPDDDYTSSSYDEDYEEY